MTPSLSIVVPVCNEERTLARQVHRLLEILPELTGQFELLVIDNGSTDHTGDVADELALEYPQVKVFRHGREQGMDGVTETALARARGDVLMMLVPGQTLQPAELHRLWGAAVAQGLDGAANSAARGQTLLTRLSRWGQSVSASSPGAMPSAHASAGAMPSCRSVQLLHRQAAAAGVFAAAAVSRPASFLEHLRGLSALK